MSNDWKDFAEKPKPDWRDGVVHTYDVRLTTTIEVIFDAKPSRVELREALLTNALDRMTMFPENVENEDIEYKLLEVQG